MRDIEEMRAEAARAKEERRGRLSGFEKKVAELWNEGSLTAYEDLTPQWQKRVLAFARRMQHDAQT